MTAYDVVTKIIIADITDTADTTATSMAGLISDYLETLDSTSNPIYGIDVNRTGGNQFMAVIVTKA